MMRERHTVVHTLSLDLVALRKSEVGSKKIVVIGRHCIADDEGDEECSCNCDALD
jgi:hypothetical protein